MLWCPIVSVPPLLLFSPLLPGFQHKSILEVPWVFQACSYFRVFVLSSFLCLEYFPPRYLMVHSFISFRANVIFKIRLPDTYGKSATPLSQYFLCSFPYFSSQRLLYLMHILSTHPSLHLLIDRQMSFFLSLECGLHEDRTFLCFVYC